MSTSAEPLRVLCIGGIDPSGGAGLARDAATLAGVGVTPMLVPTCIAIQDSHMVQQIEGIPASTVRTAIGSALTMDVAAVKIGLLHTIEILEAVASALQGSRIPVILDPVLKASNGGELVEDGFASHLDTLAPAVTLVTPNLDEARTMLGSDEDQASAARELVVRGWRAALVTGGDAESREAIDHLDTGSVSLPLVAPRVNGASPRGTGCAMASLIAAASARGEDLEQACRWAKGRLLERIRGSSDGLLAVQDRPVWPHAGHPFE